jgi:hypothetical protein
VEVSGTKQEGLSLVLMAFRLLSEKASSPSDIRDEKNRRQDEIFKQYALIKKKTKFTLYIRKFRWDRVQSHDEGFPSI